LTTDQIPLPQHSCRQNSISGTRFVNVSPATTCSRDVSQKVKNYDTLVDVIFEQPYCRISNVVDKKVAQRQAASRHLKDLVTIGVLEEIQVGKEKRFIHPKLMQLLSRDSNEFKRYAD
jgi:predicted transcriptional regulator